MVSLTHSLNVISDGSITGLTPRNYDLAWVLSDFEVYGMSRPEWKEVQEGKSYAGSFGFPMTVRYYDTRRTDISKGTDTRKLALEVFSANAPAGIDINAKFISTMKDGAAFTDFTGGDEYNPIITANNLVYPMGNPVLLAGGDMWVPVRMLRVSSYNDMKVQLSLYPLLAFNATISTRAHSGRGVDPFGQLGGKNVKILPFSRDEINWLPAYRIRMLARDEAIPPTYYPAR